MLAPVPACSNKHISHEYEKTFVVQCHMYKASSVFYCSCPWKYPVIDIDDQKSHRDVGQDTQSEK
jgi:hypothetical protein